MHVQTIAQTFASRFSRMSFLVVLCVAGATFACSADKESSVDPGPVSDASSETPAAADGKTPDAGGAPSPSPSDETDAGGGGVVTPVADRDAQVDADADAGTEVDADAGPRSCGGFANLLCPRGQTCVIRLDLCDPADGGRDCPGICVRPSS